MTVHHASHAHSGRCCSSAAVLLSTVLTLFWLLPAGPSSGRKQAPSTRPKGHKHRGRSSTARGMSDEPWWDPEELCGGSDTVPKIQVPTWPLAPAMVTAVQQAALEPAARRHRQVRWLGMTLLGCVLPMSDWQCLGESL